MFLDTTPTAWVITAAILSVSISSLIRPVGQRQLSENLKQNLRRFSPFVSGIATVQATLAFINWRLSGITDTHAAVYVLGRLYFDAQTPGKKRVPDPTSWSSIGRRGLLMVVTVPCYTKLLLTDCSWGIKITVTCFIVEAIYVEIFLSAVAKSPERFLLHRAWPTRTFMGKRDAERDRLPMRRSPVGATATSKEESGHNPGYAPDTATSNPQNLCERIQHFWTTSPGVDRDSSTAGWSTHYESGIVAVLCHTPQSWTCSHYRCLTFRLIYMTSKFAGKYWSTAEMLAIAWLTHLDMRPFMLPFAQFTLSKRVGGIVSQVILFTFLNCVGMTLFALMCFRVLKAIPGCRSLGQWYFTSPQAFRIAVFATYLASWLAAYIIFLRHFLMNETVLSYLLEATMFPIVAVCAEGVAVLVFSLERRRQRVYDSGLGEAASAVAENINQPQSYKAENNALDERSGTKEPRCHDQGKVPPPEGVSAKHPEVSYSRSQATNCVLLGVASFVWFLEQQLMRPSDG